MAKTFQLKVNGKMKKPNIKLQSSSYETPIFHSPTKGRAKEKKTSSAKRNDHIKCRFSSSKWTQNIINRKVGKQRAWKINRKKSHIFYFFHFHDLNLWIMWVSLQWNIYFSFVFTSRKNVVSISLVPFLIFPPSGNPCRNYFSIAL